MKKFALTRPNARPLVVEAESMTIEGGAAVFQNVKMKGNAYARVAFSLTHYAGVYEAPEGASEASVPAEEK